MSNFSTIIVNHADYMTLEQHWREGLSFNSPDLDAIIKDCLFDLGYVDKDNQVTALGKLVSVGVYKERLWHEGLHVSFQAWLDRTNKA